MTKRLLLELKSNEQKTNDTKNTSQPHYKFKAEQSTQWQSPENNNFTEKPKLKIHVTY